MGHGAHFFIYNNCAYATSSPWIISCIITHWKDNASWFFRSSLVRDRGRKMRIADHIQKYIPSFCFKSAMLSGRYTLYVAESTAAAAAANIQDGSRWDSALRPTDCFLMDIQQQCIKWEVPAPCICVYVCLERGVIVSGQAQRVDWNYTRRANVTELFLCALRCDAAEMLFSRIFLSLSVFHSLASQDGDHISAANSVVSLFYVARWED